MPATSHAIDTRSTLSISPMVAKFCLFCWVFMAMAHLPSPSFSLSYDEKMQRFDALYSTMMSDPSNLNATIEYTELAVDIGYYEAAIPPMERLLLNDPTLTKVQLELGILYNLLGSKDIAKGYFNDVVASADATAEQKAQANTYLAQ